MDRVTSNFFLFFKKILFFFLKSWPSSVATVQSNPNNPMQNNNNNQKQKQHQADAGPNSNAESTDHGSWTAPDSLRAVCFMYSVTQTCTGCVHTAVPGVALLLQLY